MKNSVVVPVHCPHMNDMGDVMEKKRLKVGEIRIDTRTGRKEYLAKVEYTVTGGGYAVWRPADLTDEERENAIRELHLAAWRGVDKMRAKGIEI